MFYSFFHSSIWILYAPYSIFQAKFICFSIGSVSNSYAIMLLFFVIFDFMRYVRNSFILFFFVGFSDRINAVVKRKKNHKSLSCGLVQVELNIWYPYERNNQINCVHIHLFFFVCNCVVQLHFFQWIFNSIWWNMFFVLFGIFLDVVFVWVFVCVCVFLWYATNGYLLSLFFVAILGMILYAINIFVSFFASRHWTCKWLFIRCTITRCARMPAIIWIN